MGGAETWLLESLRLWARDSPRRVEVDFLVTSGNQGQFDDEVRALGSRIHYVPFGRRGMARFCTELRTILREGSYEAIHDHQAGSAGFHMLAGAGILPSVRVVHIHNPLDQFVDQYATSLLRKITMSVGWMLVGRMATHVVSTSWYALDTFRSVLPEGTHRSGALYCGFKTERFLRNHEEDHASVCGEMGWPEDSTIILFAGRIDGSVRQGDAEIHKNAPLAIQIGIDCAKSNASVHMILAGALSDAVPELEHQIAEAGLVGRMRFIGVRPDIERLMSASHVLLFPSRVEGLGMVAIEAQSAGLPVVASANVPKECGVVPGMVDFISLEETLCTWVEVVNSRLQETRQSGDDSNALVAESEFNIIKSVQRLERLYGSGEL